MRYDPVEDLALPQGQIRPHHWKLKNLRAMLRLLAAARGLTSEAYLAAGPYRTDEELTFYGLAAALAGDNWDVLQMRGLPLEPAPPAGLSFGKLHFREGQAMPVVACFFLREDGVGVLCFRGTATVREMATDAATALALTVGLRGAGLRGARFQRSFAEAYTRRDERGRSVATFVRRCLGLAQSFIFVGHSLGGALALLATYEAVSAGKEARVVTVGGAQAGNAAFCLGLAQRCAAMLSIVNDADVIPWLRSPLASSCQCCRLVVAAGSLGGGFLARYAEHYPLYYAALLYRFGTSKKSAHRCCGQGAPVEFPALAEPPGSAQWAHRHHDAPVDEASLARAPSAPRDWTARTAT